MLKKIALLLLLIAPMSVFAQKFAHFRSMDIIYVMPEFAKAQTDIQAMQKQYEAEIKRASDEFSKKFADKYKNMQRVGDIPLGDYHTVRTEKPILKRKISKGVSLIIINTPKGEFFFEKNIDKMELFLKKYGTG